MTALAELLSNQYAFFAELSRVWRAAWGKLPKRTQAITLDISISQPQLQWSFGSCVNRDVMKKPTELVVLSWSIAGLTFFGVIACTDACYFPEHTSRLRLEMTLK